MRCISTGIFWNTIHNPFDGDVGRALYVSPAGVTDGSAINYRNLRLLSPGPASVCDQFPAIGDGPLGLDAHVALAKTPDELTWTVPADYLTTEFAINVRPHQSGLELDAISGYQIVTTDDGEPVATLHGVLIVVSTTKLDGGGVRVWFRYLPTAADDSTTSFRVEDTADPATVDPITIGTKSDNDYQVDLVGLADQTDYTFAIIGITDAGETQLGTFDVTGDDSGPDVDLTLTAEIW